MLLVNVTYVLKIEVQENLHCFAAHSWRHFDRVRWLFVLHEVHFLAEWLTFHDLGHILERNRNDVRDHVVIEQIRRIVATIGFNCAAKAGERKGALWLKGVSQKQLIRSIMKNSSSCETAARVEHFKLSFYQKLFRVWI